MGLITGPFNYEQLTVEGCFKRSLNGCYLRESNKDSYYDSILSVWNFARIIGFQWNKIEVDICGGTKRLGYRNSYLTLSARLIRVIDGGIKISFDDHEHFLIQAVHVERLASLTNEVMRVKRPRNARTNNARAPDNPFVIIESQPINDSERIPSL